MRLIREKTKGVDAECQAGGCFHVWYGPMGLPTAREAWAMAEQHVRETGHPVEVNATMTTVIKPAEEG
jgi:hypothetical protein